MLDRREDAEEQSHGERDHDRREHEDERRAQALPDQIEDRPVLDERHAQVEPEQPANIDEELRIERPVQAERVPQLLRCLRGGVPRSADDDINDVPRRQVQKKEVQRGDGDDHRHRLHDAEQNKTRVGAHAESSRGPRSPARRAAWLPLARPSYLDFQTPSQPEYIETPFVISPWTCLFQMCT